MNEQASRSLIYLTRFWMRRWLKRMCILTVTFHITSNRLLKDIMRPCLRMDRQVVERHSPWRAMTIILIKNLWLRKQREWASYQERFESCTVEFRIVSSRLIGNSECIAHFYNFIRKRSLICLTQHLRRKTPWKVLVWN